MNIKLIVLLQKMLKKYAVAENPKITLEQNGINVDCEKGKYHFYYDFTESEKNRRQGEIAVPLLSWRSKRRYIELRNVLDKGMVGKSLASRIQHIAPSNEITQSLKDIIIYEVDLLEFVLGQKTSMVFCDMSDENYANMVLSTDENIKISLELGLSKDYTEPILLHEVIGRKGIASDLVVDTQMQQYPIYVLKGKNVDRYNDIDFELYGLNTEEIDCVRFIIWFFKEEKVNRNQIIEDFMHLEKTYQACLESSKNLVYVKVKEKIQ